MDFVKLDRLMAINYYDFDRNGQVEYRKYSGIGLWLGTIGEHHQMVLFETGEQLSIPGPPEMFKIIQ